MNLLRVGAKKYTSKQQENFNFEIKTRKDMKGVSYITDKNSQKKAVIIDLKTLEKYDEQIEDLFDAIIAESRRDEPSVKWEDIKKRLSKKGKL